MPFLPERPQWKRDGHDWPNREASRFVSAGGLEWHVQVSGSGPVLLLVHGIGAATHSWRDLIPQLASRFTVVAPDLPGHGFTELPMLSQLALPHVSKALARLLKALDLKPALAVGHSAGAAIIVRMSLDGDLEPDRLVSINGALMPFAGAAGVVFPAMAKLLYLNPFTPRFFAWRANPEAVERLMQSTGSRIDPEGLELYERLLRNPSHVAAALGLMAHWDLNALVRDLPKLEQELLLLSGERDKAVAPKVADRVLELVPSARKVVLPELGHLAHEERPDAIAPYLLQTAKELREPALSTS